VAQGKTSGQAQRKADSRPLQPADRWIASSRFLIGDAAMEAVEWALAAMVGVLLLIVLMLGLLVLGVWLLRMLCRIWNGTQPATGDQEDVPS
jgi:hypothetical protein